MPKFRSPKGQIIEVSEEHAEQVLRKQRVYVEVQEEVQEKPKRTRKRAEADER